MIYAENILLCIAMPLVATLLFLQSSAKRFVFSFLIGMMVCLLSAYIGGFLELASGMSKEDVAIFLSPVTEEAMKFLPILLYLFLFEPDEEWLLLTSAGIGAGFATFENCCYLLMGAKSLPYMLVRGAAVGIMHLVSMVALTLGLNLLRYYKMVRFSGILGALSLAMTFHGLYNLLVSVDGIPSYIGYAMPVLCALLLPRQFKRFKEFTRE